MWPKSWIALAIVVAWQATEAPAQTPLAPTATPNHQADILRNRRSDAKLFQAATGLMKVDKIQLSSSIDQLDVPAYLFQPLQLDSTKKYPALVWVYGGSEPISAVPCGSIASTADGASGHE